MVSATKSACSRPIPKQPLNGDWRSTKSQSGRATQNTHMLCQKPTKNSGQQLRQISKVFSVVLGNKYARCLVQKDALQNLTKRWITESIHSDCVSILQMGK